jgi:hypothetical protein
MKNQPDAITVLPPIPRPAVPLKPAAPEVDPFREIRELAEAVKADCQTEPAQYLNEIRVPGGGE